MSPDSDDDDYGPLEEMRQEIKRDYREWAAAREVNENAPYVCGNCGRKTHHIARKRCRTCCAYRSRYGVERPPELFGLRRNRARIK